MLSVNVNLAPQLLDVNRYGDAMPFTGSHITEIKTSRANCIGCADVKFGITRTSHPFGSNDVYQGSLLARRRWGIVKIHYGSPVVDQVPLTVGVFRQGRTQSLLSRKLGKLHNIRHFAVDSREPQCLGGSELHKISGVFNILHV